MPSINPNSTNPKMSYVEGWRCIQCSSLNGSDATECSKCKMPYLGAEFKPYERVKCPSCGQKETTLTFNICTQCGQPLHPSRLSGKPAIVAVGLPESRAFCLVRSTESVILDAPNKDAERLFLVGGGDMMPLLGQVDQFYRVYTVLGPGYIGKSTTCIVEVGLEPVKQPLGFTRAIYSNSYQYIVTYQEDGMAVPLLRADKEYPIIEESEKEYKIQLDSGVRGFLSKQHFFRTLTPESVISEKSPSNVLKSIVGIDTLRALGAAGSTTMKDA